MEELTAALATSFSVSKELNTTAAEHPRFSQYKLKLSPSERQEARRRKILEVQKNDSTPVRGQGDGQPVDVEKVRDDPLGSDPANRNTVQAKRRANSTVSCTGRRFDFANHARSLTEGVFDHGDHHAEEEEAGEEEEMEVQTSLRRPGRYYQDQLMYSEWLVEVPNDFEKEWLMVVCPVGKRRLVISARGQTTAYSKGGFKCMTFPSQLPGGNRSRGGRSLFGESVILDCVYCEKNKTYYVLDMMYWKNMPIYDSETEFRFYWMHEKLQETELVSVIRKSNPYRFIPLPSFPCTAATISNSVACANFDIDGLLFYHKRTHYTFGPTPLVVWLKTYMVPDVLNIAVPYKEVAKAPPSYTNYSKHLDSVKDQTYGSAPEKDRVPSAGGRGRGGRGRGRGRGGGAGRGRGDGRKEKSMDASDTIEENSSADNSLNFSGLSSASETTPQKERGILQMPKAFNFGTSPDSPFSVASPESKPVVDPISQPPKPESPLPNVPIMSPTEAIADLNAKNTAQTVSETTEEEMCAGGDQGNQEESPGKKNKSKKGRNRGRKGRNSKMDISDAQ